jgi:bifunctional DNA-binding transcriptional regulator/antitoxin component of YhaV-PrlF toxin-antitoxin module
MPESFLAAIQKLRRVVIPPNVFKVMGLKEGDQVRVTVELVSSVQGDANKQ